MGTIAVSFSIAESGIHSHRQNYQAEDKNGYDGGVQTKYYKTNQKLVETTAPRKPDSPSTQKLIVSAWGIIGIILGVIIFSTIAYYVFILYPYICKKSQSYNIIELTDVNSVCTVSNNVHNVPLFHSSNDISANR